MNARDRIDLAAADEREAVALWPAVKAAHLFADRSAFLEARAVAPWRVRIDRRQRAAVLERWRPHLDIMAIQGLWAPGRDVPAVVEGLRFVARAQGFSRVLSPLIAEEFARPYRAAGMEPVATVIALRVSATVVRDRIVTAPGGVRVRPAHPGDMEGILAVDAACFEPFWAYGRDRIDRALTGERLTVAESETGIIGYTLSTVERGSGTLGRLGVVPAERSRGVGETLLAEALRSMARAGAMTISLCTQIENSASRSLYARCGLRELPGRLQFFLGDA